MLEQTHQCFHIATESQCSPLFFFEGGSLWMVYFSGSQSRVHVHLVYLVTMGLHKLNQIKSKITFKLSSCISHRLKLLCAHSRVQMAQCECQCKVNGAINISFVVKPDVYQKFIRYQKKSLQFCLQYHSTVGHTFSYLRECERSPQLNLIWNAHSPQNAPNAWLLTFLQVAF